MRTPYGALSLCFGKHVCAPATYPLAPGNQPVDEQQSSITAAMTVTGDRAKQNLRPLLSSGPYHSLINLFFGHWTPN